MCDSNSSCCAAGNTGGGPGIFCTTVATPTTSATTLECARLASYRASGYASSLPGCRGTVECIDNPVNINKNIKREPRYRNRPTVVSNNWWKSTVPTTCACNTDEDDIPSNATVDQLRDLLSSLLEENDE